MHIVASITLFLHCLLIILKGAKFRAFHPLLYIFFYLCVFLLAPILWAILWKWLRNSKTFQKSIPHPTQKPWGLCLCSKKWYWVIVSLTDGAHIAGKYGDKSLLQVLPRTNKYIWKRLGCSTKKAALKDRAHKAQV